MPEWRALVPRSAQEEQQALQDALAASLEESASGSVGAPSAPVQATAAAGAAAAGGKPESELHPPAAAGAGPESEPHWQQSQHQQATSLTSQQQAASLSDSPVFVVDPHPQHREERQPDPPPSAASSPCRAAMA